MTSTLIDALANAVLYEGHILYPYRASAKKNRRRFTLGRVYPEACDIAENGVKPCLMQTQCLVEAPPSATLAVTVRFLHPMERDIGALAAPLRKLPAPDNPDFFHVVPELEIEGTHYPSRQEAVERAIRTPALTLSALRDELRKIPFSLVACRSIEPILDHRQHIAGVIVRKQEAIAGRVELKAEPVNASVFKITVRIVNQTPVPSSLLHDPDEIVMRTLASTHTILRVENGEFISLIDPPPTYARAAEVCRNIGAWPILVGEEQKNEHDTMVSSPITLYDYPKITPESPDDLFDPVGIGGEKRGMGGEEVLDEPLFNPAMRLETVSINGVSLRKGDMVRVRPKSRADAMNPALAGKIAMIESIGQDAENKTHLALVLEDVPGREPGLLRQPGHRFLYGTDEVEPLEGE
jgi:hydrogenase maturation protease